jgi:arylsulfatase
MHFRTHVKKEHQGVSGVNNYADGMIEHDNHVGQLLDTLDKLKIADNTFVYYSTDNGPHKNTWPDAGASPFRSEKNTNWEGGWRVPAMVKWPGHIKPNTVSNGIVRGMDFYPTILAVAGKKDIKADLLDGYKSASNGREYKVHIDGYNVLDHIQNPDKVESPRKEVFYFTDDGDLSAMRYGPWKFIFMEQRMAGTLGVWANPFTPLRVPLLLNLRRDPYEIAPITSNTYYDWMMDRIYLMVPAQAYVAKFLATFKEFPPRMKAGSFSLDKVMEKMSENTGK